MNACSVSLTFEREETEDLLCPYTVQSPSSVLSSFFFALFPGKFLPTPIINRRGSDIPAGNQGDGRPRFDKRCWV